jgi:peptide subunit release factor 1 (eRF1)
VVSLYLDLRPNQQGRDAHDVFCRRAFADELKAFEQRADQRLLARAFERIDAYLAGSVEPSSNGLALFAAAGDDELFEAVQLESPIEEHRLVIGPVPHLYPLVRMHEQYPRYAAVLVDTNRARIIVFGLGAESSRTEVEGVRTRRHSMGGWSQTRYQRQTANLHLQHFKEVAETLERVVREEDIPHVIVAGDSPVVARLRDLLPVQVADRIVDVLRLDRNAGENEVVGEALEALRRKDAETDRERVADVIGAWHAAGLGTAGPEPVLRALQLGQVDEILLTADPASLKAVQSLPEETAPVSVATSTATDEGVPQAQLADRLVTLAAQTGARVRIIEDPELLRAHGGVAAALRFRI